MPAARRTATCLFALVIAACSTAPGGVLSSFASGEVAVETREHGPWSYAPDRCYSGEWQSFFGVDLVEGGDGSDRITRLVEDPVEGVSVVINVPDTEVAVVFDGVGCERFDVLLERQNSRVNNIWDIDGHADILCEHPDASLRVDVAFSSCH